MSLFEAFLLALVQGITEFLPISSSAHLILVPYLFGWPEHHLHFDIVTNAGTLLAAIFYFRHDLAQALSSARRHLPWNAPPREEAADTGLPRHLLWKVVLASIPALVAGSLLYHWFATTARHPLIIAGTSIGFGVLLLLADRFASSDRPLGKLGFGGSFLIGLAQAFALVPGTSRSGVTITAARLLGHDREAAARFSFLLAIPVGAAAFVKDLFEVHPEEIQAEFLPLLLGFVVAGLSAYLVIGWLLEWLRRQTLTIFVVYRILLGLVILAVAL
jgi:undecaprenyl-diphosphatase